MKVKIKTSKDILDKIQSNVSALNGKKAVVGHLDGGENAWLAGIHEYGCRIPVTPKMRAWFRGQGIYLSKSKTQIVIPERSFLRAGFDEYHEQVLTENEKAISLVLQGKVPADLFVGQIGQQLASKIKEYAINLSSPANSGFTIAKKGSSNPLVKTGDMIGAITYRVE